MRGRKVHLAEGHGHPAICGTNSRYPDKCYAVRGRMSLDHIDGSVSCKRCRRMMGLSTRGDEGTTVRPAKP